MRRFLSVCPSVMLDNNSYLKKYYSQRFETLLTTLFEKFMSANGHRIIAVTGWAQCQRQVAFFLVCLKLTVCFASTCV